MSLDDQLLKAIFNKESTWEKAERIARVMASSYQGTWIPCMYLQEPKAISINQGKLVISTDLKNRMYIRVTEDMLNDIIIRDKDAIYL